MREAADPEPTQAGQGWTGAGNKSPSLVAANRHSGHPEAAQMNQSASRPDKVVHGLLLGQLGHGGQHAKGVAAQHDDVLGVAANTRDLGVLCKQGTGRALMCMR